MKWIRIKDQRPGSDTIVVAYNIKCPFRLAFAIYRKKEDLFLELNYAKTLEFALEVTHYIEIKEWPGYEVD